MDGYTASSGQFVQNGFSGDFSTGVGPVGPSGSGDIVLPGYVTGKKSKKKLVFIGIGIFIVALAAGLIVFLVFNSMPAPTNQERARQAFNNYANYLLYGEDDEKDITEEYISGYDYYASLQSNALEGGEPDIEYFENLKQKYESLHEISADNVDGYDDVFWLFYYNSLYPFISRQVVTSAQQNGVDSAEIIQTIEEYYKPFIDSSNSLVQDYGKCQLMYLLSGYHSEDDYEPLVCEFPDYRFEVYSKVWEMKELFYE